MRRNRGFSQPISEKERTSFSTSLLAKLSRSGAMTLWRFHLATPLKNSLPSQPANCRERKNFFSTSLLAKLCRYGAVPLGAFPLQ
jgi:hypothetical protein